MVPRIKAQSFSRVKGIKWRGLDTVLKNLNLHIKKIEGRTVSGMLAASLKVKRDAIILAPIDTGNLRNSTYVVTGGGGTKAKVKQTGNEGDFKNKSASSDNADIMRSDHNIIISQAKNRGAKEPFAEIGFTAFYALLVHESVGAHHRTGQAKFLERAFLENKKIILETIRKRAEV